MFCELKGETMAAEVIYIASKDNGDVLLAGLQIDCIRGEWQAQLVGGPEREVLAYKAAPSRELALAEIEHYRQNADHAFRAHPLLGNVRFRRVE